MAKEYRRTSSGLQPFVITRDMHADMGRIVRACAEIEDIIRLFVCKLANVDEGLEIVLLGRATISSRLKIAGTLARAHGGKAKELFVTFFESENFKSIINCRNVIAHGVFLGRDEGGLLSFVTNTPDGTEEEGLRMEVVGLAEDHFRKVADAAEEFIPLLEHDLKVGASREARRKLTLAPHSKAQRQRTPSAKPKPPPQS